MMVLLQLISLCAEVAGVSPTIEATAVGVSLKGCAVFFSCLGLRTRPLTKHLNIMVDIDLTFGLIDILLFFFNKFNILALLTNALQWNIIFNFTLCTDLQVQILDITITLNWQYSYGAIPGCDTVRYWLHLWHQKHCCTNTDEHTGFKGLVPCG